MPQDPLARLLGPAQVGPLALRNRLVMAPMTRGFSPGGLPGDNVADYYRRRAEGGVGLIITEGTTVPHPSASSDPKVPVFHGQALGGWAKVVRDVHAAGAKIFPQIWHVGLVRRPAVENLHEPSDNRDIAMSPSGYIMPGEAACQPMSDSDIADVIAAFATAAASARELGFDGIEIHGAHGYLVDQFYWAETNRRTDAFGGDLAARARFGAEVVKACRAATAPDFPIAMRFSQFKQQDYDARLADSPRELEGFLGVLADAGTDIFHASQRRFWEPTFEGSSLNLAGWAKRLTGKPAITVGSVGLEGEFLASLLQGKATGVSRIDKLLEMLERDEFDLVAVGRALLVNPDWPAKIAAGAYDEIKGYQASVLTTLV